MPCLATHLPVWRELKLSLCIPRLKIHRATCYTPSRLKGIETGAGTLRDRLREEHLATHLPVWRELKLVMAIFTVFGSGLATHLPVWRELKQWITVVTTGTGRITLLHTFPFEGNWNFRTPFSTWFCVEKLATHLPVWRELKQSEYKMVGSMIKLATHLPVWRELKLDPIPEGITGLSGLLHTFPFEGNWNFLSDIYSWKSILATHLPVWRELKLQRHLVREMLSPLLATHLPVWRELKL